MNANTLFEIIPPGCGGRWAFGSVVLTFLIVYNETCGPTTVFSLILAMIYGFFSAKCKNGLKNMQIPYIRATNKFDFICLFLAMWMDILAILTACAALARTLSSCLDAMTGGLARIFILGRNSPTNEPWPDVLGVAVVFLVTGMFMLGLENSRAFGCLMTLGMLGLNVIISYVSAVNGSATEWKKSYLRPNGFNSFLTAAALGSFLYPSEIPTRQRWKKYFNILLFAVICITMILTAVCLSTVVHKSTPHEYIAVPLFTILEENNFHKLVPAAACLLMLVSSGSLLELFPELYKLFVRLATSEWKILLKQISYESPDSGNPVLAVFIAGSLCAMLAFACPLQNLTHILAASHIFGNILRAFYLLYMPFRPKFIPQANDSTLSYSRLTTAPISQSLSGSSRRSLWNINLPKHGTLKSSKPKPKVKREVDKEWLLLGEPSSPCPITKDSHSVESTILSDGEQVTSDFEFPEKVEDSDSDSSTDIDVIVDEYRQKVRVTTAGPMEKNIRVPSVASWRVTIFAIALICFGITLTVSGLFLDLSPAYITGIIGILIISITMSFIPKYTNCSITGSNVSPLICTSSLSIGSLLMAATLENSWPAIVFWFFAGLAFLIRCDKWCCSCFDAPRQEQLLENVSVTSTSTITLPCPPKSVVIPGRIQGHNQTSR